MVLLESRTKTLCVPNPRKRLRKADGESWGLHSPLPFPPTLSWGLSGAVVSMGSRKQDMKGRDLKPQGLKWEPMAREAKESENHTNSSNSLLFFFF